jgi:hypothetical protein
MWFTSLDTNSPWGTSFPLSVPVQKAIGSGFEKKTISKPSPIAKPVQQNLANEFIQVSTNQRWNNNQNIGFDQVQNETLKKVSKISPDSLEDIPSGFPCDPSNDEETSQNLYKTELCRSFEETGTCRYGLKCQFAHGRAELRHVNRHPKYKTEVCKTFHTIGTCPYGKRCRFIHSELPNFVPQSSGSSVKFPPNLQKSDMKAPIKPKISENQNLIVAANQSWSSNWTSSFPSSTNVNVNPPVVKGLFPAPFPPAEQFSSGFNSSLESNDRKSRLGIFQQICS